MPTDQPSCLTPWYWLLFVDGCLLLVVVGCCWLFVICVVVLLLVVVGCCWLLLVVVGCLLFVSLHHLESELRCPARPSACMCLCCPSEYVGHKSISTQIIT